MWKSFKHSISKPNIAENKKWNLMLSLGLFLEYKGRIYTRKPVIINHHTNRLEEKNHIIIPMLKKKERLCDF